jgi:hypothetical protein
MKTMNKDDAIQSLKNLKDDLGWKDIMRVLKENVKDARKELLDEELVLDDPIAEVVRANKLRSRIKDRISLINLPDILIALYLGKEAETKDFDPYE